MDSRGKIISSFYVIKIDNQPIYVGYTNRPIKQRFREHRASKDLPEDATVELLDTMEFEFTWDERVISEEAARVSAKEASLISKFDTADSKYQKGLGDRLGGQTFANVIGFVRSNRDNPKYLDMSPEELLRYLENYRKRTTKLINFISNYRDPRISKLSSFISRYRDPRISKLSSFISNYKDPRITRLSSFISRYKDHRLDRLSTFISHYKEPRLDKLTGFINSYKDLRLSKLSNFICNYKDHRLDKLAGFIKSYKDPRLTKLSSFIGNYKDTRLTKLAAFISHYRP